MIPGYEYNYISVNEIQKWPRERNDYLYLEGLGKASLKGMSPQYIKELKDQEYRRWME